MANIKISELPLYSGSTKGITLIVNDSGNTQTYKIVREDLTRQYQPYLLTGSTEYTFSGDSNVVSINTLSATTINLNPTPQSSDFYVVKVKHDASQYPVSVLGNGYNIDGVSGITINVQNSSLLFLFDGDEYIII